MITLDEMRRLFPDLDAEELERWIENRWVLPERASGAYLFREIDVARVRLISELYGDLAIGEEAMPLVLSLLDQLYGTRRRMRLLCEVVELQPAEVRRAIVTQMIARMNAMNGTGMSNPPSSD